jgi:hypothetical protein
MKHAVEMGSVAVIYIPSFIKIGSCIPKLMGEGVYTQPNGKVISEACFHFFETTCMEMVEGKLDLHKKSLRNRCPP